MTIISFASNSRKSEQETQAKIHCNTGINTIQYGESDIDKEQAKWNYGVRGWGYWHWKPIIIKKALDKYGEVFYMDTDYSICDLKALDNLVHSTHFSLPQIVLFQYSFPVRTWTKRDCFVYMDCDSERYWNTPCIEAGLSYWCKGDFSNKILLKWNSFCKDKRIISDAPNTCDKPNLPEFRDHRHDQSILSNLKEKYNICTIPISALKNIISGADI